MAAFVSAEVPLAASTATKLVDAQEFDRRVLVYGDAVRVAFTEGTASSGARLSGSALPGGVFFVLAAHEELWAYNSSTGVVGYLTSPLD